MESSSETNRAKELVVLFPCHSLEDFPTHHSGEDANSLLASFVGLWHPALIDRAKAAPDWRRVDDPPADLQSAVVSVPSVCESRLSRDFVTRARQEGATVVVSPRQVDEVSKAVFDEASPQVAEETVTEFQALGFAYLLVSLLTRQMRYASNLDETQFRSQVVEAASLAMAGDITSAYAQLTSCFNMLAQEKDHYYPVDAYILDVSLVAETTLGEGLARELKVETPRNLLVEASVIDALSKQNATLLGELKAAIERGDVAIVGGEEKELATPIPNLEEFRESIAAGIKTYERILGVRPVVYGRRRAGLSLFMPGVLRRMGFLGALHASFEDGKIPDASQALFEWEGVDQTSLSAISRTPLDANEPGTYLAWSSKLGATMDADHVATLLLVHWPGRTSPWLSLLRRVAAKRPTLGKFVTVNEYLNANQSRGRLERFEAYEYRSGAFKQVVSRGEADPISQSVRRTTAYELNARAESLRLIEAATSQELVAPARGANYDPAEPTSTDVDELATSLASSADSVAKGIVPKGEAAGVLVFNPMSFVRRTSVPTTSLPHPPKVERPVYAAVGGENAAATVDIAGTGFVWLAPASASANTPAEPVLAAEGRILRNEFFEARINEKTGGLASIVDFKSRGTRLSQQLALRYADSSTSAAGDRGARYSTMIAESVSVQVETPICGRIQSRGKLVNEHETEVATFSQTFTVWRGSRVLTIEIELEPKEQLRPDPWSSYFASRFAWSDAAAELFFSSQELRQPTRAKTIEAPYFVEIEGMNGSTTLFTGGCPYHQRIDSTFLDSLLIVSGESARRFRLGVGIDVPYPLHEAKSFIAPPMSVPSRGAPKQPAGWFLHLDCRNVIATSVEPILKDGGFVGERLRLLEIAGRPASLGVSCHRSIREARRYDLLGNSLSDCLIEKGAAKIEIQPNEWVEMEVRW